MYSTKRAAVSIVVVMAFMVAAGSMLQSQTRKTAAATLRLAMAATFEIMENSRVKITVFLGAGTVTAKQPFYGAGTKFAPGEDLIE